MQCPTHGFQLHGVDEHGVLRTVDESAIIAAGGETGALLQFDPLTQIVRVHSPYVSLYVEASVQPRAHGYKCTTFVCRWAVAQARIHTIARRNTAEVEMDGVWHGSPYIGQE